MKLRCVTSGNRLLLIEVATALVLLAGIAEGAWGLLQLLGIVESGHPRYPVTGSFYNPGPFGCFIGSILPVAVGIYPTTRKGIMRLLAVVCILFAAFLLPGCMSRTGWAAAAVGCAVVAAYFLRDKIAAMTPARRILLGLGLAVAAGVCAVGAYSLKPDSADGRLLIWKIAIRAAARAPIDGVGWQNVAGAYGNAQEQYFASGAGTDREMMLAGVPAYVFNEYLQLAIAYGVAVAVAFVALMALACREYFRRGRIALASGLVAIAVCCLSSYPFQFREFRLLTAVLLLGGLLLISRRWIRYSLTAVVAVAVVAFCATAHSVDVSSQFARAQSLHNSGAHAQSMERMMALLPYTSDPMPLNIIGKDFQALGRPDSAEHYFRRAAYRVPNRLYPHYLLMKLYSENPADSAAMLLEARLLLTKRPKTQSPAVDEMRTEAMTIIKSHTK
jgi:O-antigen ligase